MISKRPMTRALGTFAVMMLVASAAIAAPKKDKKKSAEPAGTERKAGMMEEGEKDPAETETAEDGAFAPGKTYVPEDEREGAVDENGDPILPKPKKRKRGEPEEEPKKEEPRRPPRKTIGVFGEALIGFGKVPVPSPGNVSGGSATSFGFLVGGHYDLSTSLRLQLRIPWSTASADGSSSSAFGNPELAGRLRLTEPGAPTEWAVRLGIGVPIAQGQPDPTASARDDITGQAKAYVQRLVDGSNGWHDPELYTLKRLPISLGLLFTHRTGGFRFGADLKAVVQPSVGGGAIAAPTDATGGRYEKNNLALDTVLGGSAAYEVFERGFFALAAWGVYRAIPPVEYTSSATSPTKFQFALEPKILAQFGQVVPSVGFVLPIGGQLGGQITGLRLHVDVIF